MVSYCYFETSENSSLSPSFFTKLESVGSPSLWGCDLLLAEVCEASDDPGCVALKVM